MIVNAQTCDKNRVYKQASKGERANARRGIPLLKNFELIRHTSVVCNDLFFHHRCYRPQTSTTIHPVNMPHLHPSFLLPSTCPLPLSSLALPPPPRAARHAARLTCLLLRGRRLLREGETGKRVMWPCSDVVACDTGWFFFGTDGWLKREGI
jgi:hypothetical protein